MEVFCTKFKSNYSTIWYDIWYTIRYMIWYIIWYDTIRYGMIWYMIWYDMIWYMIWYDKICYDIWYDMTYLLTAIGLPPGGSSTVHSYTQTIHRTTKKKCIEQHKNYEHRKEGSVTFRPFDRVQLSLTRSSQIHTYCKILRRNFFISRSFKRYWNHG
jgi:hypothetical protein